MTRFFRRRIVAWASRDLGASTGGTPMSQCEPDGSRGFHGIKGSEAQGSAQGLPWELGLHRVCASPGGASEDGRCSRSNSAKIRRSSLRELFRKLATDCDKRLQESRRIAFAIYKVTIDGG
jgi:hypothetical protein